MRWLMWVSLTMMLLLRSAGALSAWFDEDWQYRMPITLDSAQVAAVLNDFPVLINTTNDEAFVRDNLANNVADPGGGDIVLTASDGTTVLPHEIEFFKGELGTRDIVLTLPADFEWQTAGDQPVVQFTGIGGRPDKGRVPEVVFDARRARIEAAFGTATALVVAGEREHIYLREVFPLP